MRETWSVNEQITRPFLNATQKPDVIVTEKGRNPVVIEVKVDGDTPNHELLSVEPSIHGGKKSRCNLEKKWEQLQNLL